VIYFFIKPAADVANAKSGRCTKLLPTDNDCIVRVRRRPAIGRNSEMAAPETISLRLRDVMERGSLRPLWINQATNRIDRFDSRNMVVGSCLQLCFLSTCLTTYQEFPTPASQTCLSRGQIPPGQSRTRWRLLKWLEMTPVGSPHLLRKGLRAERGKDGH